MFLSMCLPNASVTIKKWRKFNFWRSKVALKSEYSFSYTGFPTKIKEASLTNYFIISRGVENRSTHAFPKGISAKSNTSSLV